MNRGPSVAGVLGTLFLELVDWPPFLLNRLVSVRAIVLLGVGDGCKLGLGCGFWESGCAKLFVGMLAMGGGRFDL